MRYYAELDKHKIIIHSGTERAELLLALPSKGMSPDSINILLCRVTDAINEHVYLLGL